MEKPVCPGITVDSFLKQFMLKTETTLNNRLTPTNSHLSIYLIILQEEGHFICLLHQRATKGKSHGSKQTKKTFVAVTENAFLMWHEGKKQLIVPMLKVRDI